MPPSFLPAALLHDCPFFYIKWKGVKGETGKRRSRQHKCAAGRCRFIIILRIMPTRILRNAPTKTLRIRRNPPGKIPWRESRIREEGT